MAMKKPPFTPFLSRNAATRVAAEVKKPLARTGTESAADLVAKAKRLRAHVDKSSYELGLTLRELQRRERYTELDCKSFEELLDKRELMSRQTAHKLIAIVNAFDEPTALELGSEKAYQVIRYTREKHKAVPAAQVLALDPAVPVKVERKTVHIPLSRLSARALGAAVSAMRQKAAQAAAPKARFATVNRRLAQLLRHAGVDAERISTRHRRNKPSVVRIELTIEEAEDLLALVRARNKGTGR
jgi:hypothetical protein